MRIFVEQECVYSRDRKRTRFEDAILPLYKTMWKLLWKVRGWETKCLIKRLQFVCSGKSWKRERLKFWTEITRNSNPPSHPGAYSIKPFHKLRPNESWILPKLCGNLWAMFGHNFWICNLQRNKFVGTGTWANIIKLYLSVSLTLNYVLFINNKAKLRQIPNDS